jgi:hypothetical protein
VLTANWGSAILIVMFAGQTFATESLEQTVNYLIDHVAKSDATFIRNGVSHTPAEAVAHIKAKYGHFKSEIKTPEDFIRLTASKSLLTGKPYRMRARDGKEDVSRYMAEPKLCENPIPQRYGAELTKYWLDRNERGIQGCCRIHLPTWFTESFGARTGWPLAAITAAT